MLVASRRRRAARFTDGSAADLWVWASVTAVALMLLPPLPLRRPADPMAAATVPDGPAESVLKSSPGSGTQP
jgi:hypothetical protein